MLVVCVTDWHKACGGEAPFQQVPAKGSYEMARAPTNWINLTAADEFGDVNSWALDPASVASYIALCPDMAGSFEHLPQSGIFLLTWWYPTYPVGRAAFSTLFGSRWGVPTIYGQLLETVAAIETRSGCRFQTLNMFYFP